MKQLSGLDAVFLHAETLTTPMNVVATIVLDAGGTDCGYEEILKRFEERLPWMDAFRKRLVPAPMGLGKPVWVDDDQFDLHAHVKQLRIHRPTRDALEAAVARIAERALDRSRPLWEAWVIEGLEEDRVALVTKVHHAVLDGVSGAAMLVHLFDRDVEPIAGPDVAAPDTQEEPLPVSPLESPLEWVRKAAERAPERTRTLARAAGTVGQGLARMARSRLAEGRLSRDTAGFSAPTTSLNRPVSRRRKVAYARTRLDTVATIRAAFGGTVNDVVVAACTAALRDYLLEGDELPERPLVAAMPVSTRRLQDAPGGNRVSGTTTELPVHIDEPMHRYWAVCRATKKAKHFHRVLGDDTLASAAELVPGAVLGSALRLYSGLGLAGRHAPMHNLVISNVPGPRMRFSLAGAKVDAMHPHGPLLEGSGLNITAMSYAGSLDIGILACQATVSEVQWLADRVATAVEELAKLAEMELAAAEEPEVIPIRAAG